MTRLVFWTSLGALATGRTRATHSPLRSLRRLRAAAGSGPGAAATNGAAGGAPATDALAGAEPLPRVSLIVAAYNEEAVIADKVADALALDWPRDRLELIVAVDGGEPGADTTAELARAAGADRVLELPAAARSAPRTPRCERPRATSSPSPTRTRAGPRRVGTAHRRVRRPGGGLRVRAGVVRQRGRHEPGGAVLALRAVAARPRVGARLGDGGQRGDLRRPAGGLHRGRSVMGHDLSFPSTSSSAAGGRSRSRRGRRRRWCPRSRASGGASGG